MTPPADPRMAIQLNELVSEELKSIELADREDGIEDITQLTVYLTSLAHAAFKLGLNVAADPPTLLPGSNCAIGRHDDCSVFIATSGYTGRCWCACHQRVDPTRAMLPELVAEKLEAEIAQLRSALRSIANNSCCGTCQEAAKVAKAALAPHTTNENPPSS